MEDNKPFVITVVGAESSGKTILAMHLAKELNCQWVPEFAREYLEQLGREYTEKDLEIIAGRQLDKILGVVSRESSLAPYPLKGAMKHPSSIIEQPGGLNVITHDVNGVLRPAKTQPRATSQQPWSVVSDLKSAIGNRQSAIVIDGGMMNLRMWARIKFKMKLPVVEEALKNDVTDLYLLCRPRKEWTPDPLREAPTLLERSWIYNQYLAELMRGKVQMEIITVKEIGDKI